MNLSHLDVERPATCKVDGRCLGVLLPRHLQEVSVWSVGVLTRGSIDLKDSDKPNSLALIFQSGGNVV
jgi:hypothetical protein